MMCEKGLLAGQKIAGVRFIVKDGAHHIVDSNEISFILAAQGAVKQVTKKVLISVLYFRVFLFTGRHTKTGSGTFSSPS